MTVYGDALFAVRARVLAIALTALVAGICAFVVAYYTTPRIEVVGYVEVARLHHVDAEGNLHEELAVPAVVLAGQVNSGAFFEPVDAPSGKPIQLRRARIIARVPPKTENIELSARADTAEEGIRIVTELVQRMSSVHQAHQQATLERLQKRQASVQAEFDELQKSRRQLESIFLALKQNGGPKESVQNFILVSLRAQQNKEMRELERLRLNITDAIDLTKERNTRLIGNVIPYRASVLACLAFGIVAGILGGLLAAAVVVGLAYRRGNRA